MPADNSIASDSISAKLIEVSRVAESLDTVLHETQDGLHIFESAMNATMTSSSSTAVDRKVSSGNTSDVRRNFLRRSQSLLSFFFSFRIGIPVSSHPPKTSLSSRLRNIRHHDRHLIIQRQSVAEHLHGHGMSRPSEVQSTLIHQIQNSKRLKDLPEFLRQTFRSTTQKTASVRRFRFVSKPIPTQHHHCHRKIQAHCRNITSLNWLIMRVKFIQSLSLQRHRRVRSKMMALSMVLR